jgi:hypothetical protein
MMRTLRLSALLMVVSLSADVQSPLLPCPLCTAALHGAAMPQPSVICRCEGHRKQDHGTGWSGAAHWIGLSMTEG